jgi:hypothetical protein
VEVGSGGIHQHVSLAGSCLETGLVLDAQPHADGEPLTRPRRIAEEVMPARFQSTAAPPFA